MAVKLHDNIFLTSSSSSNPRLSLKQTRTCFSSKNPAISDYLLINWKNSRRRCITRLAILDRNNCGFGYVSVGMKRDRVLVGRQRRLKGLFPLASADEGVTVNGSPQASTSGDVAEMRIKLDRTLQGEEYNDGLVQSLHNAARTVELAIKEHCSRSKIPWFTTAWLGVDKNSWVKALSYQASVYSLLQATSEISSRGDRRDRDINVFVQKSLLRQYAPLESIIREKLSEKQPEIYDWFWSEQVPAVVTSFINYFEGDSRFSASTVLSGTKMSLNSGNASDVSLLMLALTSIAAITKLGPAKISCSQFVSTIPDITGRLMDMMIDFVPVQQAYDATKKIGLRKEFLSHFGPRVASYRVRNDGDAEEVVFWVNLVQKQLKQAIDRERIWSRLTTSESIEVLERDLAIFGFFIALGRRMQDFLSANGFDSIEDPISGFIRYLIGGSVLYYPQLSSISSYQLYVEVVCEELDWLPFYPGYSSKQNHLHGHRSKQKGPPNAEAIPLALEVCSHWMQSFIKYSKWLENPANVKAARFLSRGHDKLTECMEEMGMLRSQAKGRNLGTSTQSSSREQSSGKELASFDQALESVEEALIRLEQLLQELHVSNTNSGKEHLKAACSDLEKIRKLKKEAEFLEASFRAKAASLQQGDHDSHSESSGGGQQKYSQGKARDIDDPVLDHSRSSSRGIWNLLRWPPTRKSRPSFSGEDKESTKQTKVNMGIENSENGIRRFEVLRNELMELEKRVQRTADKSENKEDVQLIDDSISGESISRGTLVQVEKKENIVEKSIDKLKETSRDVWQGTQLLAIDVAAATGLLRRALIGDELTEKEKQALKRTMTDLASVVPIGVLMLLPVTAVGHAAMLAAIQRYFPALIPSTYGPERLDLLRQLEKVREMETNEVNSKENVEEFS